MPARRGSGPKPIPTAIKRKMGNPGRRPLPENEPQPPEEMPDAPAHLDRYAREEWDRMAPIAFNMGVLTTADRAVFSAYCMAYSRWRRAEEVIQKEAREENKEGLFVAKKTGTLVVNPLLKVSQEAAHDMLKYAVEMGLTASARARLAVSPQKKEKSKYKGLMKAVG